MPLEKLRHANFQPFNPAHKGQLHRDLGIPEDQPIPVEKLHEAAKSTDPKIAQRARLALVARTWHHGTLHLPKK